MKRLNYFIVTAILGTILLAQPVYGWRNKGMTGSGGRDNQTQEQRDNWKDKSSENDPRAGKVGRKVLEKITPQGWIIKGAEKFGEKYKQFRDKSGRGTGTGSTTDEYNRRDRRK